MKDLFDEIIVDNFAGGGGASTGIELATGRPVAIAVNHDPYAILMHRTNHPQTLHLQESVWDVDPKEVCGGKPVGLSWFSPDCKHFSKAKGGKPVDKNIRGLSWVVIKWAMDVQPRVIMMENVEEIQTWGPLVTDEKGDQYPDEERSGETFQAFIRILSNGVNADCPALDEACEALQIDRHGDEVLRLIHGLGYRVEYRELIAADYGAPTSRKRFVLIARCDGREIVWPKRTHAPRDSDEVKSGKLKPYHSAAEILNWDIPRPSIFASKQEIRDKYGCNAVRPLADKTMRRVIRGIDKFTIRSGNPFILQAKFNNDAQDIHNPLTTITAVGAHELVAPTLIQYHSEQNEYTRAQGLDSPISTIDASNRYGLSTAYLVEYFGNGNPLDVRDPLHTVTARDREALCTAHIVKFKGDNLGQTPDYPLQTITTSAGEFAACTAKLVKIGTGDYGHWPEIRELLNEYCDYNIGKDEILLLNINGIDYFIYDIELRMLTPTELYAAMGFPSDYIIDRDYTGKPYPKTQQVARCGNAVCPPMASAVVKANFPEWCDTTYSTMAELSERLAG